jgi:DNA-binding NarL/FixJ family response regulator
MAIQVAIVEDNAGIRNGWSKLIDAAPGFHCLRACGSGEEALQALPELKPEVVLMDINLPGMSGIECTARLKQLLPEVQVLMVTVHSDNERVFQALKAGASGYLLKRSGTAEILSAVADVMCGGVPMSSEIARLVIESFRAPPAPALPSPLAVAGLSEREEEVLRFLAEGYSNKEIAGRIGTRYETVRSHLKHIYEKLHVRGRTEAVAKYFRNAESSLLAG